MKQLAMGLLAGCLGALSACAQAAVPMPLIEGARSTVEPSQAREPDHALRVPTGAEIGQSVAADEDSPPAGGSRAAGGARDARGSDEKDERPRGGGHPTGWRALVPGALR